MTERLVQILQQLHDELENVEHLDDDDRASLASAVAEIKDSLDQEEVDSAGLAARLQANTSGFAESHPALAKAAGQIADMLAQMGI